MGRYNNGIIYTNDNCIGCNKCITNCSLMGANISIVKNGKALKLIPENVTTVAVVLISVYIMPVTFGMIPTLLLQILKKVKKYL